MLLTTIIIGVILLILTVAFTFPIFLRYLQLFKDYRNITPVTYLPLVAYISVVDRQHHMFYKLLLWLSKECQDEGKGAFCIWSPIWPTVFLCSGKGLETFINNSKQNVKSFYYKFFESWFKTGLLTSKIDKWKCRRRLLTPSFHDNQLLQNYLLIFNEQSSIFVRRLDEYANESEKSHDLLPYISACTLDMIVESTTGAKIKAQSDNEKSEFAEITLHVTKIVAERFQSPWLWPTFIFNLLPIGREHNKAVKILHGLTRQLIKERLATFNMEDVINSSDKKPSTRRLALLDNLLTSMNSEKLSLDDIQEELDTFIYEGHDNTATAFNFFCYLMGSYPDVQAKLHAEMDSIFGDDLERECTMEDIERMTYLDCCIKESMRFFPPVPIISREVQEDFVYHNQIIRKGTPVVIFIHGILHDANVYPHPEHFDPERFAAGSKMSNERSQFDYIPFSIGSRNCVGQRFAGLQQKVVLSTLFRRFSFRSTQTIGQLHVCGEVGLRADVPIQMIIKHRQHV